MNDKVMGSFYENLYDLLYQPGVSAYYKEFFLAAHAVTLCMQQQEILLLVTKWFYAQKHLEKCPRSTELLALLFHAVYPKELITGGQKLP